MDREKELAFIRSGDWPNFPLLPMKRPQKTGHGWPDFAVMAYPYETVLFLDINLFDHPAPAQLESAEQEKFESLEALLDAGWMVD